MTTQSFQSVDRRARTRVLSVGMDVRADLASKGTLFGRIRVRRDARELVLRYPYVARGGESLLFGRNTLIGLGVLVAVGLVSAVAVSLAVYKVSGSFTYVREHVRYSLSRPEMTYMPMLVACGVGTVGLGRLLHRRGTTISVRHGNLTLAGPIASVSCPICEVRQVVPSGHSIAILRRDGSDLLDEMDTRNLPCDGVLTQPEVAWTVATLRDALGLFDGGG